MPNQKEGQVLAHVIVVTNQHDRISWVEQPICLHEFDVGLQFAFLCLYGHVEATLVVADLVQLEVPTVDYKSLI